jgi:hypothetical protein
VEKDTKIKQLSGTAGKLEFELASKSNQLDRLELVTVNPTTNTTSSLRNCLKLKAALSRTTS